MQSDAQKFQAFPCEPPAALRPAPQAQEAHAGPLAPYTPRTVWQTPHGMAPHFTARRSARHGRTDTVAALVRRGMRLTYRLRRLVVVRSDTPRRAWVRHHPWAAACHESL
jgi:hypothetical protein